MSYPNNIKFTPGVTVTGTGGAALAEGDTITTGIRDIVISQGNLTRVVYTARDPDVQRGCHMLQLNIDGTWTDTMEADQADWSYFGVSITATADRAKVVHKSDDAVEVAFIWDEFDLSSYSGGGIIYRDWAQAINYAQGQSNPNWKLIDTIKLTKTIRVQRGEPGYYVGWHSFPYVGLPQDVIPNETSEDTAYGERELGLGGGSAVAWSSNGRTARWPAWADDEDGRWTAQGLGATTNKIWWAGIKDPHYAPYTGSDWIAVQGGTYPDMQATGPYYVADIHNSIPVAKIMVSRIPREIGGWKVGTYGGIVSHFCNEDVDDSGVIYRHQIFIGCKGYTADSSSAYANEPSASIQTWASGLAASLAWPEV